MRSFYSCFLRLLQWLDGLGTGATPPRPSAVMTSKPSAPADPLQLADQWAREVLAAAEALRQSGHHKRLRDVTIVLPIDLAAVEAVELACLALAQGELSDAAEEFADY